MKCAIRNTSFSQNFNLEEAFYTAVIQYLLRQGIYFALSKKLRPEACSKNNFKQLVCAIKFPVPEKLFELILKFETAGLKMCFGNSKYF